MPPGSTWSGFQRKRHLSGLEPVCLAAQAVALLGACPPGVALAGSLLLAVTVGSLSLRERDLLWPFPGSSARACSAPSPQGHLQPEPAPALSLFSSAVPPTPFSPDASSPLLTMPAEFFHPAVSASQKGQEKGAGAGTLPKIALQGSWASLRSPSVNCTLLRQVWTPPGSSEGVLWGAGLWVGVAGA